MFHPCHPIQALHLQWLVHYIAESQVDLVWMEFTLAESESASNNFE